MKVLVNNNYDHLQECVLCYPCFLQSSNNCNQPDKILASIQYNQMISKLIDHDVKVRFLDLNTGISQVFARDIGFAIEEIMFISNMTDSIRQSEINGLKELAIKYKMKTHIMENKAEGGDVIIGNKKVYIGQGNRTNSMAADEVSHVLHKNNKHHEVVKVGFNTSKIHLDCVFNIINKDTCIMSRDVFEPDKIKSNFSKVIRVPDEDTDFLAPNILQLGNNDFLCSSENFSKILQSHGFNSSYIKFSEFIKCDGSLGCCVLPLTRI